MAKLTDFMISRVRAKLLKAFLSRPGELFYVRELTRITSEEINAIRRELSHMQSAGMVKGEHRGNRLYYFFKASYPYYAELLALVAKSTGLGKELIKNKQKLGKVKFIMFSGKFVRGLPRTSDQVDILIVGKIILPQLNLIMRNYEAKHHLEINYSVVTEDELKFRKNRRDPFILSVLAGSRIMIIGDEEELVS